MIKAFISKVGEGRTLCAIAECAAQKNKKVVFITTEIHEHKIVKSFDLFKPGCEKLVIKFFPITQSTVGFYKLIEKYSEEYEVICIDLAISPKSLDLQKLNDSCFKSFMNPCEELWVTVQANRDLNMADHKLVKKSEKKNLLSIKQICESIQSPLLPGEKLIRAIDLETKEVKIYNINNLFKNKNL